MTLAVKCAHAMTATATATATCVVKCVATAVQCRYTDCSASCSTVAAEWLKCHYKQSRVIPETVPVTKTSCKNCDLQNHCKTAKTTKTYKNKQQNTDYACLSCHELIYDVHSFVPVWSAMFVILCVFRGSQLHWLDLQLSLSDLADNKPGKSCKSVSQVCSCGSGQCFL